MLRNIRRILKPNGRALVTIMLMNSDYPNWTIGRPNIPNDVSLIDKIHIYNITCFYYLSRGISSFFKLNPKSADTYPDSNHFTTYS